MEIYLYVHQDDVDLQLEQVDVQNQILFHDNLSKNEFKMKK